VRETVLLDPLLELLGPSQQRGQLSDPSVAVALRSIQGVGFSLYKIVFHFKALVWESTSCVVPLPIGKAYPIAILLQAHGAIYAPHTDPPVVRHTPNNMGDSNIV